MQLGDKVKFLNPKTGVFGKVGTVISDNGLEQLYVRPEDSLQCALSAAADLKLEAKFSVGQEVTFTRSGNKGVIGRVKEGERTIDLYGDVLIDIAISVHRGRRHWTERTQFRQRELERYVE